MEKVLFYVSSVVDKCFTCPLAAAVVSSEVHYLPFGGYRGTAPANPQAFNRYSYVLNNPIRNSDPYGHVCYDHTAVADLIGTCLNEDGSTYSLLTSLDSQNPWQLGDQEKNGHIGKSAEEILFESFVMPANVQFGRFGGQMTSQNCGRSGRPPCDARHPSVDGIGETGSPIYAIGYGRIVLIGHPHQATDGNDPNAGGFGKYVVIEHNIYGDLLYSVYAHNNDIFVNIGDIVEAGSMIATMGNSGTRTVHLHFEIRKANNIDWQNINPFRFKIYWPSSVAELTANYVDLGSIFGYDPTYADWQAENP